MTGMTRIGVQRFQPGNVIPVRFDPRDPAVVAVNFEGPAKSEPASGNPYHDRLLRSSSLGAVFLPPPDSPRLYFGTGDRVADTVALHENEYLPLGASAVVNGSNPRQAIAPGPGPDEQLAAYWGKTRRAILGIPSRPLEGQESARLGGRSRVLVSGEANGSPASGCSST